MNLEIRDRRKKSWFFIDNEIIDEFPDLGPHALLAYMVLCRHADDDTQSCCLLLDTIAKKARISRASVCRGISELKTAKLVEVQKFRDSASKFTLLALAQKNVLAFPNETQTSPYGTTAFHMDSHNNTLNITTLNTAPSATTLIEEHNLAKKRAIESVYYYYITQANKNPKQYEFTDMRRKKLMSRFNECLPKVGNDIEKATELMKCSVDGCLSDPWWKERKLNDLIRHIFKSYEQMERWWGG